MTSNRCLKFWALTISIFLIFFGILVDAYSFSGRGKSADSEWENNPTDFLIVQKNSLTSFSNPANPINPPSSSLKVVKRSSVVITAYSSTPWETDDNPHITAAGTWVREGIVANNLLPFGTKIRIPEIYGDKVFTVEDRMSWKKGNYHIDIWFPDYHQALAFGVKRADIEVLEM